MIRLKGRKKRSIFQTSVMSIHGREALFFFKFSFYLYGSTLKIYRKMYIVRKMCPNFKNVFSKISLSFNSTSHSFSELMHCCGMTTAESCRVGLWILLCVSGMTSIRISMRWMWKMMEHPCSVFKLFLKNCWLTNNYTYF